MFNTLLDESTSIHSFICNYIIYIIIYISGQLNGGSYWLNWICNYDYNRLLIREGIAVLNY